MLNGKKIVVGVTGSIAAYKTATLVRLLVKDGAEVKVVMTKSAADFITPLTLGTLSKNEVSIELFDESAWANHVMLGRWADLMVIAPLSCNTLAKMAAGACDNLLLAVYLSATCPVYVAPAMDEDMWKHPAVKSNLTKLESYGNKVIPVTNGELASGLFGEGRMAEPEQILDIIRTALAKKGSLSGKKALVTAGPTYEAIDPVRFVGNHSSGKMGIEIAKSLHEKGADVILVLGPVSGDIQLNGIKVNRVESAQEMYNACTTIFPAMDIGVMAAAVADYTPVEKADIKIKKADSTWSLNFKKTQDILKNLGGLKKDNQVLVGFALETNNEEVNAKNKLQDKNADLIVLNSLNDAGAGFGHDTNKITIFDRKGNESRFDMKSKKAVAEDIVQAIIKIIHA
ncbi:bifunctional phosphopantothenoylcysteine decarboxylase/phosphopantothenate--cysteine ligase CoaBC [Pollutibacter soli]|uniref:bifunctional phosphopantothenoylcysteine decarboxylase/phosphopantothenate--cysteine ligase CoaBC n=1 Tax=Pollutibacter soli TaxID=3034157 RepID=UPI003013CAC7